MPYYKVDDTNKQGWIDFLHNVAKDIDGKPEEKKDTDVTNHENGDVACLKDAVGVALSLLTNAPITIN